MSSRYELPQRRAAGAGGAAGAAGASGAVDSAAGSAATQAADGERVGEVPGGVEDTEDDREGASAPADSASMWESLSGGEDPTEAVADRAP